VLLRGNCGEGYGNDGVFALETCCECLFVDCDSEVSCSCSLWDWDVEVEVFKSLSPFVWKSSLFSSCNSTFLYLRYIPSFARAAASSSGVGSVADMMGGTHCGLSKNI
jgi:hypothetical protein